MNPFLLTKTSESRISHPASLYFPSFFALLH
jgi:hypothetical protein